ncbi:MAG: hypothetical protein Aureis2KO_04530 [Aureisphaera sp.]
MKPILLLPFFLVLPLVTGIAQTEETITSIDFVEVLNDNVDEAVYYYKNNWNLLRIQAQKDNAIHSYELQISLPNEEGPTYITLRTSYANKEQYDNRENYFGKLIEARTLKLLNDKKPGEFRKIVLGSDFKKVEYGPR